MTLVLSHLSRHKTSTASHGHHLEAECGGHGSLATMTSKAVKLITIIKYTVIGRPRKKLEGDAFGNNQILVLVPLHLHLSFALLIPDSPNDFSVIPIHLDRSQVQLMPAKINKNEHDWV